MLGNHGESGSDRVTWRMTDQALNILRLSIDDIDEYELLSEAESWDLDIVQLSTGRHFGRYSGIELPGMYIALEDLGRTSMSLIGASPYGLLPIILPLQIGRSFRFRGTIMSESEALLVAHGDQVDFMVEGGICFAAIYLTPEAWLGIRHASFGLDAGASDRYWRGTRTIDSPAVAELKSSVCRLFQPECLSANDGPDSSAVDDLSETISSSIVAALSRQYGGARESGGSIGKKRSTLARRARAFMEANLDRPLPLTELCAEVGVSLRTLQYAFGDYYGVSPARYHALRRLAGVRRDLSDFGPSGRTVTDVAMDWGFWHLGRFSQFYRSQFGETPSQTLARRPRQYFVPRPKPDTVDLPRLRSLEPAL